MLKHLYFLLSLYCKLLGWIAAICCLLLIATVFFNVINRNLFNDVFIWLQEMEWHLFSAIFLLAMPYTLLKGGHVSVDVLSEKMSRKAQLWIQLIGTIFLLIPFCLVVGWHGISFSYEAYLLGEISGDPGGLHHRFLVKALIPIGFFSTALAGMAIAIQCIEQLLLEGSKSA